MASKERTIKLTCSSTLCSGPCIDAQISCRLDRPDANQAPWPRIGVRGESRGPSRPCQTGPRLQLVPFYGDSGGTSLIGRASGVEIDDNQVGIQKSVRSVVSMRDGRSRGAAHENLLDRTDHRDILRPLCFSTVSTCMQGTHVFLARSAEILYGGYHSIQGFPTYRNATSNHLVKLRGIFQTSLFTKAHMYAVVHFTL